MTRASNAAVRIATDDVKVAIMGIGMVGGALSRYFHTLNATPALYDPDPKKGHDDVSIVNKADVIFVAVPTPYHLNGKGFDDSFLRAAFDAITEPGKIVVIKSTVALGTTERFQQLYPQHRVLFSPEFLTEATADDDMQRPNRQIIGYTERSIDDAQLVLRLLPDAPFVRAIPALEAEFVKYFCNGFYAAKVAYANEMYDLCDKADVNYDMVRECCETEPMVGPSHLVTPHKGYRGYGGKCLPKDVRSLIQIGRKYGVDMTLLRAAEAYNNALTKAQGLDPRWKEGSPTPPRKKMSDLIPSFGTGIFSYVSSYFRGVLRTE